MQTLPLQCRVWGLHCSAAVPAVQACRPALQCGSVGSAGLPACTAVQQCRQCRPFSLHCSAGLPACTAVQQCRLVQLWDFPPRAAKKMQRQRPHSAQRSQVQRCKCKSLARPLDRTHVAPRRARVALLTFASAS